MFKLNRKKKRQTSREMGKAINGKGSKKRTNKGVILVSLVVIAQIFLMITGFNPFSEKKPPVKPTQTQNKTVDQNIQHNMTSGNTVVTLSNVNPHSYGTYEREYPPLNVMLRPYYNIYTMINVEPHNIYQQFAVTPTVPEEKIPRKARDGMAQTHLPIVTREFNVNGGTSKVLSKGHGKITTLDNMKYSRLYNPATTTEHFIGKPYMIPPSSKKTTRAFGRFSGNTLSANGLNYVKINKIQAINIMQDSYNGNLNLMGY